MNLDDASTQLLALCASHMTGRRRIRRLAVTGLPGCGKSTLAEVLVEKARDRGWSALSLSLDDVYLPRQARHCLAAHIHPLLATRGVPGTHDLSLLRHVLARLPSASTSHPVAIPRFDKGRDERLPIPRWPRMHEAPRLLIIEGWCLGIAPQARAELETPVNALEKTHDPDGHWRAFVNRRLSDYLPLWQHADLRVRLDAENWDTVMARRRQAEERLRQQHAPRAMTPDQLNRFLQHYERLGRHALASPPTPTDLVLSALTRAPHTPS